MMDRRAFIGTLTGGLLAAPLAAEAQQPHVARIGIILPGSLASSSASVDAFRQRLRELGVEFRRGTSGGGNQLRQPYAKKLVGDREFENYPAVNHVHFYGFYIGNYPGLEREKILKLCSALNALPTSEGSHAH